MKTSKVLLAKLGLDVHNRGIMTIAHWLRNDNFEVVYVGNSDTNGIISAAIQEDASLVGVSSLGGAHLTLGRDLIEQAKLNNLKDRMAFIIGGVFSPSDAIELKKTGFDAVFSSGSSKQEILSGIRRVISAKSA